MEMVQLVTGSLPKREDLSSIPNTMWKTSSEFINSEPESQRQVDPQGSQTGQAGLTGEPQASERFFLKKQDEREVMT